MECIHSFSQSVSQSVGLFVIHIVKGMWRIFSILSYQAHPFPSSTACLGRKRYEWRCRYTKRNQWNKHFAIHDDILLGKSGTSRAVVIAMASLPFHCHQNVSLGPHSHHLPKIALEMRWVIGISQGFFVVGSNGELLSVLFLAQEILKILKDFCLEMFAIFHSLWPLSDWSFPIW